MTYTRMSTKYQIVIPKEIRNLFPLKPGQKFLIQEAVGVIQLIPEISIKKLKGILKKKVRGPIKLKEIRDKTDRI
jgi:AbrB family looped-hinge helix DNA binding protein